MRKTDKEGRRKNDKIEPFSITDDMILDREMDEFLRQSMIEEADRLEEELNSDPELVGIGASDDLFLKIKARLQEMGAWEEEEGEEGETAGTAETEREENKKDEDEGREETENGKEGENSEREKPESRDLRRSGENRSNNSSEGQEKEERDDLEGTDPEEEKKREDIYQFLSEEDREALEIGRKIRTRKKKKRRYWKRAAVAVAVLVALIAVGMQGGADRNWILGALDRIMAFAGNRLQIDYQDEQENVKLNEEKEKKAWEKIKEELNIPVIEFYYKPEDMVFNKVYISKKAGEASMYYWYKETVVQVYLESGKRNSSFSFISEENAFLQDVIVSDQKIEIKIWNTTTKSVESHEASFEYQGVLYFVSGQLSFEEMEKMMSLIYLY